MFKLISFYACVNIRSLLSALHSNILCTLSTQLLLYVALYSATAKPRKKTAFTQFDTGILKQFNASYCKLLLFKAFSAILV